MPRARELYTTLTLNPYAAPQQSLVLFPIFLPPKYLEHSFLSLQTSSISILTLIFG